MGSISPGDGGSLQEDIYGGRLPDPEDALPKPLMMKIVMGATFLLYDVSLNNTRISVGKDEATFSALALLPDAIREQLLESFGAGTSSFMKSISENRNRMVKLVATAESKRHVVSSGDTASSGEVGPAKVAYRATFANE